MASASKVEKKRRSRRKARTEVSSSDSENETPAPKTTATSHDTGDAYGHSDDLDEEYEAATPIFPPNTKKRPAPTDLEQAFQAFYLRQATREFANDLDKLRSASDFKAAGGSSVTLLIEALKQGSTCFGKEERERIGGAAAVTGV
ncbi:hypothetical protein B0A50_03957 [Salinomyces thailandicus]|uniref:Ribosome assembly protein 3 n=1 Tax=Salinomyces thailandicus TaxID=706561 RepID=A0A4U0U0C9_9PEZI|nr:hypothetical protein B0A50_03957 [Salinomyces thailandica]